jgi:hypothetical protein
LTQLRLLNIDMPEACSEACAALSKLKKLQIIAAALWHPGSLPAVSACTQLTELCGEWEVGDGSAVLPLPQVLVLCGAWWNAPVELFPNLHHYRASACVDGGPAFEFSISPAQLQSLCTHCTSLRELVLTSIGGSLWLVTDEPGPVAASERVSAIQSLTALQHLTCLKFTPRDDFELVALVKAACVLEGHSLQELHLNEAGADENEGVSAPAWMQLGQLRQMHKVALRIRTGVTCRDLGAAAFVFLSALYGCRCVHLQLPGWNPGLMDPFMAAVTAAEAAGLQIPKIECCVSGFYM